MYYKYIIVKLEESKFKHRENYCVTTTMMCMLLEYHADILPETKFKTRSYAREAGRYAILIL